MLQGSTLVNYFICCTFAKFALLFKNKILVMLFVWFDLSMKKNKLNGSQLCKARLNQQYISTVYNLFVEL